MAEGMKKAKFLVNAIDIIHGSYVGIINKIVECSNEEIAIEVAKLKIEEEYPEKTFEYVCYKLRDIERLQEKELTIREVMKTTFSEEALRKTIEMYEDMLLKGLDLITLRTLFAPYLLIYDHKIEELCVSKKVSVDSLNGKIQEKLVDIGFQWLPKKMKPFNLETQNYELWTEKVGSLKNDNYRLIVKHQPLHKTWSFIDFVIEFCENIPDVPLRIETIVIENL